MTKVTCSLTCWGFPFQFVASPMQNLTILISRSGSDRGNPFAYLLGFSFSVRRFSYLESYDPCQQELK